MPKTVIYQILPRYWGNYSGKNVCGGSLKENGCGHFADIDDASLEYFRSLGCTHIWYTGVIRHATSCDTAGCTPSHPQFVKGRAGSPYAITDYYDVNPYLALKADRRMQEFEELVSRTHGHGLKVLLDFVPNHVSRDNVNFGQNDNRDVHWAPENDFFYYPGQGLQLPTEFVPDSHFPTPYVEYPARATGNNCYSPTPGINDWYETVKLNYCDFHTGTWDKMRDILLFWAGKGVDGFRCDMAELVPAEFFTWVIREVKKIYPKIIFIAEVYCKEQYYKYSRSVGFDYLYDKSGLYDDLRAIMEKNCRESFSPVELWQSTRRITANWQFLGDMQPDMLNFLENHDEQRVASEEFASDARHSFAALAVSSMLNTAPFMLYFGQEIGEKAAYCEGFSGRDGRSSIFDWWKIESIGRLWKYIHTGKGLTEEELGILDRFREFAGIVTSHEISEGNVYDLCFCNIGSAGFDPDRHFAFIRYSQAKCYLIACNFSSRDAEMTLNVPPLEKQETIGVKAFDFSVKEI